MDSDVLDVMQELGCFSAGTANSIDEVADNVADAAEQDLADDLWIDLGGEG